MQPTPAPSPPAAKGWRIALLVALAVGVFLLAPPLLRQLNPAAGSFDPGTLNAPVLAALQFFAALSMAYAGWRLLFPGLYAYVRDCLEEKLFSTLTANLVDQLPPAELATAERLAHAIESRHIAQFQFRIRCVRFLLSLLPFFCFLLAALLTVNNALSVVPH